jgi:hypothetical protein
MMMTITVTCVRVDVDPWVDLRLYRNAHRRNIYLTTPTLSQAAAAALPVLFAFFFLS